MIRRQPSKPNFALPKSSTAEKKCAKHRMRFRFSKINFSRSGISHSSFQPCMKRVTFSHAAKMDFLDADDYYREVSALYAKKFRNEVRKISARISRFPESGHQILPGVRRTVLKVFPYS